MKRYEDPQILEILREEELRQRNTVELIASENFTSALVMTLQGGVMTNKYAEGYPDKRYYGGCEVVDKAESLAISRVCGLFGVKFANVQPHSGSQANMAAYMALIEPGDTVMGMDLSQGGHLTHGSPVNFSGKLYKQFSYGLGDDERIDYDRVLSLAKEVRPKLIVAGASAYSRIIDFKRFRGIADEVGAYLMVDMAHIAGLVAAGLHPSPAGHAHIITSTTHKTLRGPRGGLVLSDDEEIITKVNKIVFPGIQGGPLMHVIAAKAAVFGEAMTEEFRAYMKQVVLNAGVLVDTLKKYDLRPVSGGTDNHLCLIDLTKKDVSGKKYEEALGKAGITVNKNTVPKETRSPFITSGIRVGTPAVTSRGLKESDMRKIGEWMNRAMECRKSDSDLATIRAEVVDFISAFPMPWDR